MKIDLIKEIYEKAIETYEENKFNYNIEQYSKKVFLVGYNDCLPFNASYELSNLGENNIYLVEFPQEVKDVFFDFKENNFYERLNNVMKISTPSKNIESLLKLEPSALFPVAKRTTDFEKRDEEIVDLTLSFLTIILENKYLKEYNNIVWFGGWPHLSSLKKSIFGRVTELNYKS